MSRKIRIATGARLHLGLLANQPTSGPSFGGAGLMVKSPGFTVSVQNADCTTIIATDEACRRRVAAFVAKHISHFAPDGLPEPFQMSVSESIPAHVGLGSGTQLGMAIAKALALWSREEMVDSTILARRVGRGRRSALGIHGFTHGGFLVDGGKVHDDQIGSMVARADFPEDWRFVLVTPGDSVGISGEAETNAFVRLDPMPRSTADRLCQIVLMDLLPSVLAENFYDFSEALFVLGRTVGEYFAPVQGGIYADRRMEQLSKHLRSQGLRGVGQTSWGPTLYVLCRDEATAQTLVNDLQVESEWSNCQFRVSAPMNRGGTISVSAPSTDTTRDTLR